MLSKRSYPFFGTSGKVHFPPGEAYDKKTVYTHSSSKHSVLPQHVTIGFEIPQETKPFDACESPRSVLDANVSVLDANVTSEKHFCGRSFRSCVHALPLRNKGSQGIGLAIIVDIHAEEKGHDCSLPGGGHGSTALFVHNNLPDRRDSFLLKSESLNARYRHQRSQPIAIVENCHTQDKPSAYNLRKDAEISRDNIEEEDDDSSSLESMESFGSDYASLWQELHNTRRKADDDSKMVRPSIFAVASVPSDPDSFGTQPTSFLEVCAFCQHHFAPGKDIFMYRGDQAFCSMECRGEGIKIDEYKEKRSPMYS